MKVNAYGRELTIDNEDGHWCVFEGSSEGKRRRAVDIQIPDETSPAEIVQYLSDLLHEYATDRYPKVFEYE